MATRSGHSPGLRRFALRIAARAGALRLVLLLLLMLSAAAPARSEPPLSLDSFFRENIGLDQDQIDAIRSGQAVAKALPPRTAAEIFLFGGVFIHAAPESYIHVVRDLERLRQLPGYLALGEVGEPPRLSQLQGMAFDDDDIDSLRSCTPGDCDIQMPASFMEEIHDSVDWNARDARAQVNALLRVTMLEMLLAYQHGGNRTLGFYNDRREPVEVSQQLAFMLSYSSRFPTVLPQLNRYLLEYPEVRPTSIEDSFYWSKVRFGLKPTLRLLHVAITRGSGADKVAYAVAEKQLYASHYFQTALDLSYCVRSEDDRNAGFYLIMMLASEQSGLTRLPGSMIRRTAIGRSVSSLEKSLAAIKATLERGN